MFGLDQYLSNITFLNQRYFNIDYSRGGGVSPLPSSIRRELQLAKFLIADDRTEAKGVYKVPFKTIKQFVKMGRERKRGMEFPFLFPSLFLSPFPCSLVSFPFFPFSLRFLLTVPFHSPLTFLSPFSSLVLFLPFSFFFPSSFSLVFPVSFLYVLRAMISSSRSGLPNI